MSLPQVFSMGTLSDSVISQDPDRCSADNLRIWSRKQIENGSEYVEMVVTNGRYIWEGRVTNDMKPEPVSMSDETYTDFIHRILDSNDAEAYLYEFTLYPASERKVKKGIRKNDESPKSTFELFGKCIGNACLLSMVLHSVSLAETPNRMLKLFDQVCVLAREALKCQKSAESRVADLEARQARLQDMIDVAAEEKQQAVKELSRNFIHTLNQKKDMIRDLVENNQHAAASFGALGAEALNGNESDNEQAPTSVKPSASDKQSKVVGNTSVARRRGAKRKSKEVLENSNSASASSIPATGTGIKSKKQSVDTGMIETKQSQGGSDGSQKSTTPLKKSPKDGDGSSSQSANGSGSKPKIPAGWIIVESRSRPGTMCYKNIYTGQRQTAPPTDAAVRPSRSSRTVSSKVAMSTKSTSQEAGPSTLVVKRSQEIKKESDNAVGGGRALSPELIASKQVTFESQQSKVGSKQRKGTIAVQHQDTEHVDASKQRRKRKIQRRKIERIDANDFML